MIFSILHFIFGYISINAKGGFIERFINLCTSKGIPLWDIRKHGDTVSAKTSIHGYMKIRNPAKQSGMKITVVKRAGLPFFTRKYKNRIGLGIGILIFALGLTAISGRAWIIEVNGNTNVGSSEIIEAFNASGLKTGSKFTKLDSNKLRISALSKLDGVSWATVNVRGCKAVIEVRETVSKPEIEKKNGTSNTVALKDGQIEIIEPYRGIAKVKPGQTVLKGNLLISGIRENRIQENLFDDSNGYVAARTTIEIECTSDGKQEYFEPEQSNFRSLYFLGLDYPFVPEKKSKMVYSDFKKAEINNVVLPFGIKKTTFTALNKKKTVSRDFLLLTAMENYAIKSYSQTLHAQLISRKIEMTKNENSISIFGTYSCFENICNRVEFSVEETDSNE